jgi:hypothetical protein
VVIDVTRPGEGLDIIETLSTSPSSNLVVGLHRDNESEVVISVLRARLSFFHTFRYLGSEGSARPSAENPQPEDDQPAALGKVFVFLV